MPPKLALFLCFLYIVWLFATERKRHAKVSAALWVPFSWMLILGSRPLSAWLGLGHQFASTGDYVEGSPFDRLIFLALIIFGLFILARRRVDWSGLFRRNWWFFVFIAYLGTSVLWSDYSFVSFKRWIKEFGNVVMVLVVLTDERPVEATKVLLARCAYLLIPLNMLLVKYYPELGRYYNPWTYQPYFGGVTTDKNMLGMTLFVFGLSQFWIWLGLRETARATQGKVAWYGYSLLMVMTFWLLSKSQSSTALGCTLLGCSLLIGLRLPVVRRNANRIGAYGVAIVIVLLFLQVTFDLAGLVTKALGRDLTFTGRTQIWQAVLGEHTNPLIGTGYYSFWLGDRVERLSRKYFYHLNEAHNGYIEVYLNSGLIGLFLLGMVFVSAGRRFGKAFSGDSRYTAMQIAFLISTLVYSVTEATFNRLNVIWFTLLLLIIEYSGVMSDRANSPALEAQADEESYENAEFQPYTDVRCVAAG